MSSMEGSGFGMFGRGFEADGFMALGYLGPLKGLRGMTLHIPCATKWSPFYRAEGLRLRLLQPKQTEITS